MFVISLLSYWLNCIYMYIRTYVHIHVHVCELHVIKLLYMYILLDGFKMSWLLHVHVHTCTCMLALNWPSSTLVCFNAIFSAACKYMYMHMYVQDSNDMAVPFLLYYSAYHKTANGRGGCCQRSCLPTVWGWDHPYRLKKKIPYQVRHYVTILMLCVHVYLM